MREKIIHNRTTIEKREKRRPGQVLRFGDGAMELTNLGVEPTEVYLEKLGTRFIEWAKSHRLAKKKKYITLMDFLIEENILYGAWKDWCKKSSDFKRLHEYGMAIIGSHREAGAAERDFCEKTVHFTQGAYSEMWREEQEVHATLAKQAALNGNNSIQIVMQEAPRTGLVKPLKKKRVDEEVKEEKETEIL